MKLKSRIIAALATLGIVAGTYTIGDLDIKCLRSENQIDIQDVRLCVSDEQLAKINADDLKNIVDNEVVAEDIPRIVELAKLDPEQYDKVSGELTDKIATNRNSQKLDELNETLALEKPEYMQELKISLISKYEVNRGVKLDDYNIHMFVIDQLLPANATISGVSGANIMDKLISLIK